MHPSPLVHSGARLLGFGAALPEHAVSSDELGAPFGKAGYWVQKRTGITSLRRVTRSGELHELVRDAAAEALHASGMDPADVDYVITTSCSTVSSPQECGTLAASIAPRAPHLYLNSACSGFCYSLATAETLIRTGDAGRVLIVAAEEMSRLIDPSDLGTSIIFGDGAGAAVVGPAASGQNGIGPVVWGSDGAQSHLIRRGPTAGDKLDMSGREVFRWAVETVPALAREACARAGVALADIDVFVPHQANLRIIDVVAERLGLTGAIIADSVTSVGNTSAASIPIALADLVRQGRVKSGQRTLLVGFGAGLSYAAQVIELP